ncbi:putative transporter [Serratia plymuthica]|uniref:Putative transporter n=1 Tax=Serratia plymuthica TaxID=82996 RepID=A0A2X4U9H7_SERPL|nr:putative transporter [Serratia plymuthica]
MKGFPPLIIALLASSLVLTIGRGVTLPFITIYLTGHFHLLPKSVGIILASAWRSAFSPACMAAIWWTSSTKTH